jgi:hypothetical protein
MKDNEPVKISNDFVESMLHNHKGDSLGMNCPKDAPEDFGPFRVEVGKRLIEEKKARPEG